MTRHLAAFLVAPLLAVGVASASAQSVTFVVAADSNPWLAGMPDGSTAISSDSAPAQSPLLVTGIDLGLNSSLTFTNVSGGASNAGGCPPSCAPLDGSTFFDHSGGAENGIAGARIPINTLVGVFLGPEQPNLSGAPAGLNFQTIGLDFTSLAPDLKQVFFIGDGLTGAGVAQQFDVPDGASRLFLGTMDGFGWFNNTGAITVSVNGSPVTAPIPEPQTYALMLTGLLAVAAGARWRRRR
jgi:hypothetical protein